jgi:hypothetical protein
LVPTTSGAGGANDPASDRLNGFFREDNAEELERRKHVYETPTTGG